MIGERKGSKILSCTHAGRVITLVPVAEVLPWHLDPLFIMHQITHGVVSAAWQNQHLHLCSPDSLRRRKTNMTYGSPELLTSKLISGSGKHILSCLEGIWRRWGPDFEGWYLCSISKDQAVDFCHYLALSHQLLCRRDIIHCLLYDNMHRNRWGFFLNVLCAAPWTSIYLCQINCDTFVYLTCKQMRPL